MRQIIQKTMDGMPRAAVLSAAATERLLLTERLLALVPRMDWTGIER